MHMHEGDEKREGRGYPTDSYHLQVSALESSLELDAGGDDIVLFDISASLFGVGIAGHRDLVCSSHDGGEGEGDSRRLSASNEEPAQQQQQQQQQTANSKQQTANCKQKQEE